ncbi:MAG: 4Fe-4S dicluster domain-containing protein [Frisingicoccus sp.]
MNISGCFLFQGYLDRYGLGDWAKDRYNAMPVKASACVDCGACETRCPYNLPIRDMLKNVRRIRRIKALMSHVKKVRNDRKKLVIPDIL